ncbi:uncharacterized protein with FMN-binding domain [Frondihabitans australicus]|uniref:Uncharacterized protein with FMN-binding domain n=1 Tax=Frondihabitans australicus TaxID=386892 RepID=A0A495IH95_9MICO|nr:uncharacterized protein with FMN-binding domain [Frondihabitans australicus]
MASAAVLAVGWQIGAGQVAATSGTASGAGSSTATGTSGSSGSTGATGSSGSSSPSATAAPSPSSSASSGTSSKSSVSGTYEGTTAETQFGPVQVEIVVQAGTITDVKALQLTDQGGRSVEISAYAAPILRQEALKAQSANIQSVSGATYTSEGYVTSLQAAIDKAGL